MNILKRHHLSMEKAKCHDGSTEGMIQIAVAMSEKFFDNNGLFK